MTSSFRRGYENGIQSKYSVKSATQKSFGDLLIVARKVSKTKSRSRLFFFLLFINGSFVIKNREFLRKNLKCIFGKKKVN